MVSFSKEAPKVHQTENDLPPENKPSASKTNRFQTVFPQSQKIAFQKMIETKIFQKIFCNGQNQKKDPKRRTKHLKNRKFFEKEDCKKKGEAKFSQRKTKRQLLKETAEKHLKRSRKERQNAEGFWQAVKKRRAGRIRKKGGSGLWQTLRIPFLTGRPGLAETN